MKKHFFTSRMKLADLIAANHSLLLLLPRFGIHLGFGEQSVQEICDRYQLNVDFVLVIFNVYTFDDYIPDETVFAYADLSGLVPYLSASHQYYLNERLPHIERHLAKVAAHAGDRYGRILHQFIADYKCEVSAHFDIEEREIFPILRMVEENGGVMQSAGKASHFADSHSELVDRLLDLTQIVYKYVPGDSMTEELNELVFGIVQLSSDLKKHALLEERLLLPYLKRLQKSKPDKTQ